MRRKNKRKHEISDSDVAFLSRMIHGSIAKGEVPSALQKIEELHIGWFQHIVSLVLYRSLGMEEEAEYVTGLALDKSYGTVKKIFAMAAVLSLSFITGIIIIIVSVWHGRIFKSFDRHRYYQLDASYLFETFILWLFIALLLKLVLARSGDILATMTSHSLSLRVLFMIALYLIPCASLLYLRWKIIDTQYRREELYRARGTLLKNIAYGVGGYLATLPFLVLSVVIIMPFESTLEKYLPTPSNPAVGLVTYAKTAREWILLFFLICCIAPVIEEVLFRGVLQNAFKRKAGPWAGILLSAGIFSLMHPQLPLGFLPLMVLGIVFGVLAEARKSLVPSMVAHGINNAVIVAVMSIFA